MEGNRSAKKWRGSLQERRELGFLLSGFESFRGGTCRQDQTRVKGLLQMFGSEDVDASYGDA